MKVEAAAEEREPIIGGMKGDLERRKKRRKGSRRMEARGREEGGREKEEGKTEEGKKEEWIQKKRNKNEGKR